MNKRQREAVYEKCIQFLHAMGDAPASTPSNVEFGYVLRCERGCGTERHLEINPNSGHVEKSYYPDTPARLAYLEYKRSRGTMAEVRLETIKARRKAKRHLRAVS